MFDSLYEEVKLKARSFESFERMVVEQATKWMSGEEVAECFLSWLKSQQTTSYSE